MPINIDFLFACATHIILNNSKGAKNCCNIMNILTLNDYYNLTFFFSDNGQTYGHV